MWTEILSDEDMSELILPLSKQQILGKNTDKYYFYDCFIETTFVYRTVCLLQ